MIGIFEQMETLRKENEELEERVETLRNENEALEARVESLEEAFMALGSALMGDGSGRHYQECLHEVFDNFADRLKGK